MAHKIKKIRNRVDEIAAERDKFNLAQGLEDRKLNMQEMRDMTHSFVDPRNVIGRDDAKKNIIHLLMDQNENSDIVPITGSGGLGKTIIAKLVYSDEQAVGHFQLRMWVCASDDFNVTRLIKEILKSAIRKIDENFGVNGLQNSFRELLRDKKFIDNLGVDELQFRLRELLKDNKFLLVLDDVWNEDCNKWMELEDLLLGGCNGRKIIVTTRNNSVATIMGTAPKPFRWPLLGRLFVFVCEIGI